MQQLVQTWWAAGSKARQPQHTFRQQTKPHADRPQPRMHQPNSALFSQRQGGLGWVLQYQSIDDESDCRARVEEQEAAQEPRCHRAVSFACHSAVACAQGGGGGGNEGAGVRASEELRALDTLGSRRQPVSEPSQLECPCARCSCRACQLTLRPSGRTAVTSDERCLDQGAVVAAELP